MKRLTALVFCLLLLGACVMPASANSAQSYWTGVDQSGAIITDGDSPILVEKELLTFDLQETPSNHYFTVEEFLAYTGKVTAEYTFYNPSDIHVTAKLLFPFGREPDYASFYDYEAGAHIYNVDTEKYSVLISGQPVETKIRHTLSSYSHQFELEKDLDLVCDSFVADDFYTPDLPVTKYTFRISGVDTATYNAANVAFDIANELGDYRIYFPGCSGFHTLKNGDARVSTSVSNQEKFDLYIFGTAPASPPQWAAYKNGDLENKNRISGSVDLISAESTTFQAFILENWNETTGVSQIDWYNAAVAEIKESASRYSQFPLVELNRHSHGFEGSLLRWYEYEITLDAGQRIVNAVTAPIYPAIDLNYDPAVCDYTYLLSPAKTWKSFGTLEIVVNTPYYLSNCSLDGFMKTDNGYRLSLNGLPDKELSFFLSTSENPIKPTPSYQRDYGLFWIIAAAGLIIGVAVFSLILRKIKK